MQNQGKSEGSWVRHVSLGAELAAAIGGFALLGFWIDRHFSTSPWGILTCLLLGTVGGLYNLIRTALKISRAPAEPDESRPGEPRRGNG